MGYALPELKIKGWDALIKELGYAGATKFMLLYESGKGNYTEEREKLFQDKTIDEIVNEIKDMNK